MPAQLRASLTYANVMATIAVFIALGGTSYAVATGSIDSREIKNDTVRSKDLRNNDVRSKDVRNRSLLARDFKAGQLPAGPQGATGARGATGSDGSAIAYAYVDAAGNVDEVRSKNVTDAMVTYSPTGGYCFDLPYSVRNAVASTAATSGEGVAAVIVAQDVNGGCQNEDVLVETRTPSTGVLADKPFYVLFN